MTWRVEKGPKVGIRRPRESLGDTELSPEQEKAFLNAGLLKPQHCQADGVPVIPRLVVVWKQLSQEVGHAAGVFKTTVRPPQVPPGSCHFLWPRP